MSSLSLTRCPNCFKKFSHNVYVVLVRTPGTTTFKVYTARARSEPEAMLKLGLEDEDNYEIMDVGDIEGFIAETGWK